MDTNTLLFFDSHPEALPLYEVLEEKLRQQIDPLVIKAQKTQISFYSNHLFGCVSFLRLRKKKDCPSRYIVVTFGLDHRLESPRIEAAVEPYPNRWTHHLFVTSPEEIDEELMGWLGEAAWFAANK